MLLRLGLQTSGTEPTRVMLLFDKEEFWRIDAIRGTVSNVATCGWTVEGSRRLLHDFVRQPPQPTGTDSDLWECITQAN